MKRKLLLVSNTVFHYRVSVYNHLNSRLQSVGYELIVLTNRLQEENPHSPNFEMIVEPFHFGRYRSLIKGIAPSAVMLFLHIRDLVVWPLLAWLKWNNTPVIYWNHGINLETPDNFLKNVVFGFFHSAADAIVLYSENEKKHIAQKHQAKIFVANNTINFHMIPEILESKSELKKHWNVNFDKIVLFVGRVTSSKRLDDLIGAAPLLDAGTCVVIVGGGLTAAHKEAIDKQANVIYLGEIYDATEVNQIFKMSDIFCIPGKNGLGINHAFFWGLPVVTEDVLHSPEIVYLMEGENGFIVKRHDIVALREKINFLLESPDLYERFSKAARKQILDFANIDKMCDGFVNAVQYLEQKSS
ncbi:MAG: glycosyltransferase family 4 protein [Woeseiales bacterium]